MTLLIFMIGSLGDTVVALPAFHYIRRNSCDARIVLLTNTPVDGGLKAASSVQILEGSGLVDEFIEYPHGRWSLQQLLTTIARIRKAAPEIGVYLMQRRTPIQLMRDRLFFLACGVRDMIGLGWRTIDHEPAPPGRELWESEASRMRRSIGARAAPLAIEDFSLRLSEAERRAADELLSRAGISTSFVVVCAGTKVELKDWGQDRWLDFIRILAERSPPIALVLIGSRDEAERSERLARLWRWKTANLCGQLPPRVSAALLERARVFVGHDSGPMHLAAAVGTPTVALFSAREMPGIWFPFGQEKDVFYLDVPCRGCRLNQCTQRGKRCLRDIEPTAVAQRVLDLLLLKSHQQATA